MKPKTVKPKYVQGYVDCFGKVHTTYEEAEKVNLKVSLRDEVPQGSYAAEYTLSKMDTK